MGIPGAIDDIRPFAALAQSATTVVYKAYQSSLERFVLLKRLRAEYSHDADLTARFHDEARIVARIQHPNIVAIHAFGSDASGAYIVAEFVDGFDLRDLIARSKIPPDVAVHILLETARGLRAAHEKGVLHRDLKPSNILISREGEVKLADFGMASVGEGTNDDPDREVRGTLAYIAPEQILGSPADTRSDLFSLGATFFEMLTGRRAFAGTDSKEILDSVLNHHPIKYLPATAGVTPEIKLICSRLMERDPGRRFASASELIAALEDYRNTRGRRLTREDLKRYLDDPELFAVPTAPRQEPVPEVSIVPDRRRARPPIRRRRFERSVWTAVATILLMTVLGYIGLKITEGDRLASARVSSAIQDSPFLLSIPPDSILALSAGEFQPINELSRRRPATRPLDPNPAELDSAAVHASDSGMTPLEGVPAGKGLIEISVDPGAGVYLDEDSVGVSSLSYPLLVQMEPGTHKVTLSNPKFPKWMTEVTVKPGSRTPVKVSLWEFVGRLDIKVSPWADIYVDDRHIGQTPLGEPIILLPGTHTLRLENPEMGVRHVTTIEIEESELLERSFILEELL